MGKGKKQIMLKYESDFWLDKARMGVRSPGGSIYWKKNLGKLCAFQLSKDEHMLEVAEAGQSRIRTIHAHQEKRDGTYYTIETAR